MTADKDFVGVAAHESEVAARLRDAHPEALGVALQMGGGPSMVYGAEALQAYDQHAVAAMPTAE